MAGHAARDWMNGIFDAHAFGLEQVTHLAQHVLRLADGHAVAGDDDDLFGLAHQEGSVVGRAALPGALNLVATTRGRRARRRSRQR